MLELFTYDFMQRSLLAAAMVGGLCSVIGVFVVLRGLAFVGQWSELEHSSVPPWLAGPK